MISFQPNSEAHLIEVHASGKVSRQDYEQALPQLDRLLEPGTRWDFLVFLEGMTGWEPGAFWREAIFDLKHRSQLGRIAVVGAGRLAEWTTHASNLIFPCEVRFFHPEQADPARSWVRGLTPR